MKPTGTYRAWRSRNHSTCPPENLGLIEETSYFSMCAAEVSTRKPVIN